MDKDDAAALGLIVDRAAHEFVGRQMAPPAALNRSDAAAVADYVTTAVVRFAHELSNALYEAAS